MKNEPLPDSFKIWIALDAVTNYCEQKGGFVFTLRDIKEIAVQIERNGEAAYRRAGMRAKDKALSILLLQMAEEERRHARWFETLSPLESNTGDLRQLEASGRALLREVMDEQTFSLDSDQLADDGRIDTIIGRSIEFENDTILFYEMLCGFLRDEQTCHHLELIIQEERKHVRTLEEQKKACQSGGLARNSKKN